MGWRRRLARFAPQLAGLLMALAAVAATLAMENAWRRQHAADERLRAAGAASLARDRFDAALGARLALAQTLAAYVSGNPDLGGRDFQLLARDLVRMERGFTGVRLARGGALSHFFPPDASLHLLGKPVAEALPPGLGDEVKGLVVNNRNALAGPLPGSPGRASFVYLVPVYLPVVGLLGAGPYWGLAMFDLDLAQVLDEAGLGRGGAGPEVAARPMGAGPGPILRGGEEDFSSDAATVDLDAPWGRWRFGARVAPAPPLRNAALLLGLAVALVLGAATWLASSQLQERIRTQERYRELVENARSMILRLTPAGVVSFANEYALEFFGFAEQELLGRHFLQSLGRLPEAESPGLRQQVLDLLERPEEHPFFEQLLACKDGRQAWVSWANRPLRDAAGRLQEVLLAGADLTARKDLEARLRELASTDALTGVANRRSFLERVDMEVLRRERYGHPLSLLALDLDHFKQVNDVHGHGVGDLALRHVTQVAAGLLRDVDLLGRMGGEEFAILLPDTGLERAAAVAERVREAVAASPLPLAGGAGLAMTLSIGAAEHRERELVDGLLQRADAALYAAKAAGRNRVERAG